MLEYTMQLIDKGGVSYSRQPKLAGGADQIGKEFSNREGNCDVLHSFKPHT